MERLPISGRDVYGPVRAAALCLLLAAFSVSCGSKSGAVSADAAEGYCPVCKMRVKSSDQWSSEIYYKDGTKLMFETIGDMLAFYSAPERYGASDGQKYRGNIERITAKDHKTRQPLELRQSSLVYKSSVNGPMGPDVVAFYEASEAEAFRAANGGQVVGLNDLTPEMVQNLRKK